MLAEYHVHWNCGALGECYFGLASHSGGDVNALIEEVFGGLGRKSRIP